MTLPEAIRKAGRGGKIRRAKWSRLPLVWFVVGVCLENERGIDTRILTGDVLAGDWEVLDV